ncbi:MAG: YihA family ribosome biogenesis GTP-binding protein [Gammaproteobacteria bacterium]|nr:YihA family ribosome biogenesis GTP-binding protein [Gammaproteobacteria bacterium]MCP5200453.1 YihA family ribosome biogenesis GTP-binding protein [Gammaproteobacteria bacterium]
MNDDGAAARKLLQNAHFLLSSPELRQLPGDHGIEVAFAGRSNSGKSSAINVLCNQRNLARTSRTPGRTQHFVVFALDETRRLVDLPGFGYAKVAKSVRAHWDRALPQYLERRQSLAGLVLLMDIRHPIKPQDEIIIAWCAAAGVPLHVLLNKADKLSRGAALDTLRAVERHLAAHGGEASSVQLFSALKQQGVEEAFTVLADWLEAGATPG